MTAGQHADLSLPEPSLDQCWQIAERKSGLFLALACRAGARLQTADAQRVERCGQFGLHLGILLQIGDDLDGLWASEGARSDLLAWPRWTLPVAYTMAVSGAVDRDRLRDALRRAPADADAEEQARHLIIAAGAVLYLATEARCHRRRAQEALLQAVPPSAARDELLALLHTYTPLEQT